MNIFNSIKFRLISGISLLITGIIVILSVISYTHEKRAIQNRIYAQLNATADLKKELVVDYINERINDLRTIATAGHFRESIFYLSDRKGDLHNTEQYRYVSNRLRSFKDIYRDYVEIELLDLKGNVIASTNDNYSDSNQKHTPMHDHREGVKKHIENIKMGGAVVMQDYLDAKIRHIDIAVGVKDEKGNARAIIVSSIALEGTIFPNFLDYSGLGHTGETLIVKRKGRSIQFINPTRYPLDDMIKSPDGDNDYMRLAVKAASGNEGIDESIDYRGRHVIGAYRYIPALEWGIVAKIDVDEAFQEIKELRRKIFVLGVLLLCIVFPLSYLIVNYFISPVVRLRQQTKEIAEGDYSIKIDSKRKDEIGELERDFNNMVEALVCARRDIARKQIKLEQANFELDRKVEERTKEISDANVRLSAVLEDIKQSEEKFRKVLNSSVDAVIISDETKKILFLNKAAEDMFGYKREDIIGKEVEILIPEEYREKHRRGFESYVANGKGRLLGRVVELYALKKDGEEFPVELSLSGWESKDKKYVSAVIRNITERKKAEENIRKLSYAVEQNPVSIVITDTQGNIEYVNEQYCRISGYSREELTGKHSGILKSGETPPDEYSRLWKTITSGGIWTGVFHNRKKSGELFWESAIISPIKDEKGNITHFIGIKENITEKRKLEEMLMHAQKMEAIGQLAGGIAHDFNNILTAIIGFGGLIQMNIKEDDPNNPYLKELLHAAERATHLTHGLLAFSRKQVINPQPVNINKIISGMEKLLKRVLREDIELKTVLADRDLNAMADEGQIEQVLMNLATNARDAMPEYGRLTISTEQVTIDEEFIKTHGYGRKREYVLISVSDTGMGMDEETRDRIFEPFFTTKEVGKGTGLGLSIAYGIIKQHEGYINCYSERGMGTTFKIYLPEIDVEGKEEKPAGESSIIGGSETILLAEDDNATRKLTKEVLVKFGYNIIEAVDGEEAVLKFSDNKDKIQLLLLDVIMPKKNGREAFNEIDGINPGIKTIFMSGYTDDIIHEKGILEEGINFLTKPVSPKALLKKVREVLDEQKG